MRGSTRNLGKGAAARPRCIPQHWRAEGVEPITRQPTVSPVDLSQGDFALPAPIDQEAYRRPRGPHSQDLEICLSTGTEPCTIDRSIDPRSGERSCCPRYPHDDFIETLSARPTVRRLDAAILSKMDHDQVAIAPLNPLDPSIGRRSGRLPCCPCYP